MDHLDDSMSLRRSSRRSITLDTVSTPNTTRQPEHGDPDNADGGSNASSSALRLGKRVRGDGSNLGGSGGDSSVNEARAANKSDTEQNRSGRTKRRRASESGRPTRKFLYSSTRLRHASSTGRRGKQDRSQFQMEPVRRSTREKRLVFATLNVSEIDKQILDPKHGYPDVDSSEEEMEPYEKLFSPKRVIRKSTRLRQKVDDTSGEGISKKVKEEMLAEGEDKDENGDASEQEGSDEEEEEEEEGDDEEGDNSEEEQLEDEAEMTYNLRKRRPVIYQYQPVIQVVEDDTPPKRRRQGLRGRGQASYHTKARSLATRAYQPRRKTSEMRPSGGRKRHVQRHGDSSTTSSGSDSDEARFRRRKARSMAKGRAQCLPMNFAPEDTAHGAVRDRLRIGASLADIDPMNIDRAVTFDSVGGLQHHVRALKEMIIFPLLYPEVFERFKINPPRGVLFYGPPGCGKTLVARALANECSKGGKKVAFFMRKGADCLSKWIGESERQLRLLFDQAYQLRPSIIFFDEIDGLAPVRSSRQDQIHSSIVSTLLALMDGLDSRGEIVVIGATNRIDAIDPALRRPGRFDREFLFPLPSREDRYSILSIHTRAWRPQLKPDFLSELADSSVGYCGADLRALCTEAALFALRRKYPQIYKTTDKLVLDVASINVAASDFHSALKVIVPTAQRSDASTACAIPEHVRPLLLKSFNRLLSVVSFVFPPSWKSVSRAAKDVEILTTFEDNLLKEMSTSLLEMETTYGGDAAGTTNSVASWGRNPATTWSANSTTTSTSNGRHGHRMNKVRTGKPQESCESSVWPSRNRQLHQKDGPSLINWSGGCKTGAAGKELKVMDDRNSEDEEISNLFSRLYQSSQPSQLDKVYFDMKDTTTDEVEEGGVAGGRSILVDSVSMETQDSTASRGEASMSENASQELSQMSNISSVSSQRYLSLTSHPHTIPMVHRPRLILCGAGGMGQSSFLSPALLHVLEEFPVKTLDLTTVFATSTKTPEEACTQVFREARRIAPSIVYLPRVDTWWEVTPETFRATLFSVVYSLPATTPLLVLATAECPFSKLPVAVKELFKQDCSKVFTVLCPSLEERKRFFYDILMKKPSRPPPPKPKPIEAVELEQLPVAPPPKPRELTEAEVDKIDKQREAVLRELRVFLRDATNKLLAERKFKEFAKPVDPEEVPDYYKIITEPMDLGAIMKKIDEHRYTTPKQWISDVDLITRNALEYNPENDSESRLLRHRAVALQDMAHSFLDHELSEDFEQQCNEIAETYKRLGKDPSLSSPLKKRPSSAGNCTTQGGQNDNSASLIDSATVSIKSELYDAPRRSLRQKGLVPEQTGFPYYSPTRPKRTLHVHDAKTANGSTEGGAEGLQNGGERWEHETMVEEDRQEQKKMAGLRAHKSRGRRSRTSESSVTGKDHSPQERPTKSDLPSGSSLSASASVAECDAHKEVRVLNNTHTRRQIMRPWEDGSSKNIPPQTTSPTHLPAASGSKPLQNGTTPSSTLSSSTISKKGANLQRENHVTNCDHEGGSNSSASNSVQAAAEALVEISQVASLDTQDHPIESMQVDSCKSTLSIDSTMDTGSAGSGGSSAPLDLHAKEVVMDHERQLALFNMVSEASERCTVEQMDRLHSTFEHLVFRHRMSLDKHKLIEDLELAANIFFQTCSVTSLTSGSEH